MREMRLHRRKVEDPKIIREILDECSVMRIGIRDEEGMFIVPVNYGYELEEEDGYLRLTLYFHGAGEGRKAEALAADPETAIEMDCRHEVITGDYSCSYSYAYRSIMGNGKAVLLTGEEEKKYALARLMGHMAPGTVIEFGSEALARTNVYRIDVAHFTAKERKRKP